MPQLGLFLLLLPLTVLDSVPPATQTVAEACAEARRIAAQGPCLRPEDCGAYRSWERLFGMPRTEPLNPELAVRHASGRAVTRSFLCPAVDDSRSPR